MRIGVDATCWPNPRGYGRFVRELVAAMAEVSPADRFVCLLDDVAASAFHLARANVQPRIVTLGVPQTVAAGAGSRRTVRDVLRLTRAVQREPLDVFLVPSVYSYFPLPPGLRTVVAVHDAIPERFPELTLPSRRQRLFWRTKVRLALWQARLVVAPSVFAAAEIERRLGVRRERIRVVLEAPAAAYRAPGDSTDRLRAITLLGLPREARWIVYVGGFSPHKRVDVLVRAHGRLARTSADAPFLVLAGPRANDSFLSAVGHIEDTIRAAGTERLVRWAGYLPDEDLRRLHAGAVAAVLPSACEGFGLPAVEAAAAGAAVVATTESPLPQLLAGGGIFVPPGDEDRLLAALLRLLDDETTRQTMATRGRARALALTWEAGAKAALEALREAAA